MSALEDVLATLAKLVAAEVVRELRSGPADLVPQGASPLGKRRHCAAVRARVAKGDPGGCVVGRTHYLTPDALKQELAACKPPKRRRPVLKAVAAAPRDELAALCDELGFRRKGAA